jgi:hypothetical protein
MVASGKLFVRFRIRAWGLRGVAALVGIAGGTALIAAVQASGGPAPSLSFPFAIAGVGLLVAAFLAGSGLRPDLVEAILGGLTGASFGVTLAEMSAQASTIEDHYKSLWVPAAIASLFVMFVAFRRQPDHEPDAHKAPR